MCDRQEMMRLVRQGYAARVRGDVDGVLGAFTDDAVFRLNAAPFNPVTTVHAFVGDDLRLAMKQLIENFEFSNFEILDSVAEGSKMAVRSMFTVRARKTGKIAYTEILDLIEFRDGKICSFAQFFDTACANALLDPQAAYAAAGLPA